MTKKDALTAAIAALSQSNENDEVVETLTKMLEQVSKSHPTSDATKAKRKEATATARAELVAKVAPVLTKALSSAPDGLTAKELFNLTASDLPADFSAPKVQNILLRELAPMVDKIEAKGKANVYRLH